MRDSDVEREIVRMTNNRKETNMNIDQLIEDVVTQLDKDPMDQMVDTETIIREYTKKIVNECNSLNKQVITQCNLEHYLIFERLVSKYQDHFGINNE